jgi:hypothetical protein
VAALPWNQRQRSPGIGGKLAMESVAAFVWNGWQLCRGIGGRIHLELVAALPWNTHPKWGNPQNYDLIIERVKTGSQDRDVKYNVIPEPPSPLDEGIVELAKSVPVRLEAMFTGEDPFAEPEEAEAHAPRHSNHRERTAYRRTRTYS